jgi:phosphate-selective porin OprO/OprP
VIRYRRQTVLAFVLPLIAGVGGSAEAQDAATPPPPADAPPAPAEAAPAVPAPAAAPAEAPPANARLDEVEQMARITARKQEIFEQEHAQREKEAPAVWADDRGFAIRSGDGSYLVRIGAQLQTDGRFFLDNDNYESNDTFLIRRMRPSLTGTLFTIADYRLVPDFAGGTLQVFDAYIDLHPWSFARLRFGKYKGTIGLERLQSDQDLPTFERALDQNLSATREVGVQLWGEVGGIVTYAFGIVNGAPDNTNPDVDIDHAKDVQGRLFVQPFRAPGLNAFGNLGLGVSASTGNRKGKLPTSTSAASTGLGSYKTPGQLTFFSYFAPATDTTGAQTTFGNGRASHLDPQLFYYYGPVGLLAEYVWSRQGVQRGNNTATLTNQSTHATVSYVLFGRESYDGPTPDVPFDPAKGSAGAFELAAQISWLKVDPKTFGDPNDPTVTQYASPTASARQALEWAAGIVWVPRRTFHLGVNYYQTRFKGGAGTAANVTNRPTENLLLGRAQINF